MKYSNAYKRKFVGKARKGFSGSLKNASGILPGAFLMHPRGRPSRKILQKKKKAATNVTAFSW